MISEVLFDSRDHRKTVLRFQDETQTDLLFRAGYLMNPAWM